MNLPDGTRLAYIVDHEAWWSDGGDDNPELMISAIHASGGTAWEFNIIETRFGQYRPLHLRIGADAWPAFVQVPEVFAALATAGTPTLNDVTVLLDRLGAVDETARTSPYAVGGTP